MTEGVYVHTGELGARSRENEALNANIGLVLTPRGAVLIDSGATHLSARDIDQAARRVTDQPIRWVINTGGQDHRWLGNSHFHAQGAELIAHVAALPDMKARSGDQLLALKNMLGSRFERTQPVYPSRLISTPDAQLDLGGVRFEFRHRGGGHTPGDLVVWLPERDVVFAGDIVYTERLLAVLPVSNTRHWLEAFGVIETINPRWVISGHGRPTDMATARRHTGNTFRACACTCGRLYRICKTSGRLSDHSTWRLFDICKTLPNCIPAMPVGCIWKSNASNTFDWSRSP